jgi:hypothetical protein
VAFRKDKAFNMGECAVSWHRDSSLERFSTIGVYNHTPDPRAEDWRIAACVDSDVPVVAGKAGDKKAKTKKTSPQARVAPPVAVRLRDGDSYFLSGNFNHNHMHAVLAGASARYVCCFSLCMSMKGWVLCIYIRTSHTYYSHTYE